MGKSVNLEFFSLVNLQVTTKSSTSTRTFSSVHPASGHKAIDTDNINDEETLRQLVSGWFL